MFSVIAPAYNNNKEDMETFLASLPKDFILKSGAEVIVVDDGSKNNNVKEAVEKFDFVKYIRLDKNVGAAEARNVGAGFAKNNLLFFVDSDMCICRGSIEEAISYISKENIDAVSGWYHEEPLNSGFSVEYWALYKAFSAPKGKEINHFVCSDGVIKKDVFEKIGGFNKNFKGASLEDYEFTSRFIRAGYKVHLNHKILVKVKYKPFSKNIIQVYRRAKKWSIFFWELKKFDKHITNIVQGGSHILGFIAIISLLAAFYARHFIIVFIIFFLIYIIINAKFLHYVFSRKGPIFLFKVIPLQLIYSFVISCGAFTGLMVIFLPRKKRMEIIFS